MSKINICLIFHSSHISFCENVIKSILGNNMFLGKVYLTVSYKEFPNWEQDLPTNLHYLIMTSNRIVVNWVQTFERNIISNIKQQCSSNDNIVVFNDYECIVKDFFQIKFEKLLNNQQEKNGTSLRKNNTCTRNLRNKYSQFQFH